MIGTPNGIWVGVIERDIDGETVVVGVVLAFREIEAEEVGEGAGGREVADVEEIASVLAFETASLPSE